MAALSVLGGQKLVGRTLEAAEKLLPSLPDNIAAKGALHVGPTSAIAAKILTSKNSLDELSKALDEGRKYAEGHQARACIQQTKEFTAGTDKDSARKIIEHLITNVPEEEICTALGDACAKRLEGPDKEATLEILTKILSGGYDKTIKIRSLDSRDIVVGRVALRAFELASVSNAVFTHSEMKTIHGALKTISDPYGDRGIDTGVIDVARRLAEFYR